MTFIRHCIGALLAATITPSVLAAQSLPEPGQATFLVFAQNRQIGQERVSLSRSESGWTIQGTGRLGAPLDLVTENFEMRYTPDWQPVALKIATMFRGEPVTVNTSFGLTTAISEILQGGRTSAKTDEMPARSVVLLVNFFGSYEALAARLPGLDQGAELQAYVAPQGVAALQIRGVSQQVLQRPEGEMTLTRYALALNGPGEPVDVQVWVDGRHRLARLEVPSASIVVVREDVSSVMTRVETARNPGDEDVNVAANGFSLAATLTRRLGASGRLPAIVLVGESTSRGRDEVVGGVPVFGQLAGGLAEAGLLVARYDPRGVGQSGGRAEAATLGDYAEDARAVVRYLRDRKDVDQDRVAVLGYGQGGAIALEAAAREKKIAALVLAASIGTTGAEFVLDAQQQALARLQLSASARAERVDLQKRIIAAVRTGQGWETIPADMRRQADTPWFRSFLEFDPAQALARARQPVLVVQPALDEAVPASQADRLLELANARKKKAPADILRLAGLDHRLAAAAASAPAAAQPGQAKVSPDAVKAIADWLTRVMR